MNMITSSSQSEVYTKSKLVRNVEIVIFMKGHCSEFIAMCEVSNFLDAALEEKDAAEMRKR